MRGCEAEDGRPTDVLPREVDRANAELFDEEVQVLGGGLTVIVARLVVGVAEAAEIDGEDAVARREQRNELPEGPLGLREPMDQ